MGLSENSEKRLKRRGVEGAYESHRVMGLTGGSGTKGICTMLELCAYVDDSGIHVPLAPSFPISLREKKKRKTKNLCTIRNIWILPQAKNKTNKQTQQNWVVLVMCSFALNSPEYNTQACQDRWWLSCWPAWYRHLA